MKKVLYIFLICLPFFSCKAQEDLKAFAKKVTQGKTTNGSINLAEPVTGWILISDLVYGKNINFYGQMETLKLDIFQPTTANPASTQKYPLYLYAHGGGFSTGNKSLDLAHRRAMAQRGFVSVSIDYRLGWYQLPYPADLCEGADSLLAANAVVRAIQDGRAALRWLVHNADLYHIDTSKIFVGGSSAGSTMWLASQYYSESKFYAGFPTASFLGGWNNATNTLTDKYTIKGMVSLWGGINRISAVRSSSAIPTLFVQGTNDPSVPYNIGHSISCYKLPMSYGSLPIYKKLDSLKVPVYAQIKNGGGHVVYSKAEWTKMADGFIKGVISGNYVTGFYYDKNGPLINR